MSEIARAPEAQQENYTVNLMDFVRSHDVYHTGSSISVHFGDSQYVGEVVAVAYSGSRNRLPIYGYRSVHFDRVAHGNVSLAGSIVVALTKFKYAQAAFGLATGEVADDRSDMQRNWFTGQDVKTMMQMNPGGLTARQISLLYDHIVAANVPGSDDAARRLTDYYNKPVEFQISTAQEGGFVPALSQFLSASSLISEFSSPLDSTRPFDIKIGAGRGMNHSAKRLETCYIIGEGSRFSAEDEVVMEVFPFVARKTSYSNSISSFTSDLTRERERRTEEATDIDRRLEAASQEVTEEEVAADLFLSNTAAEPELSYTSTDQESAGTVTGIDPTSAPTDSRISSTDSRISSQRERDRIAIAVYNGVDPESVNSEMDVFAYLLEVDHGAAHHYKVTRDSNSEEVFKSFVNALRGGAGNPRPPLSIKIGGVLKGAHLQEAE